MSTAVVYMASQLRRLLSIRVVPMRGDGQVGLRGLVQLWMVVVPMRGDGQVGLRGFVQLWMAVLEECICSNEVYVDTLAVLHRPNRIAEPPLEVLVWRG